MREENISVVIMPIPYVLTDRAVNAMKPKSNIWSYGIGITSEVSHHTGRVSSISRLVTRWQDSYWDKINLHQIYKINHDLCKLHLVDIHQYLLF